jgi:outer membrane lipoprotein SlyB
LTLADGRTIDLDTDTVIQDAKSTKGKDAKKVGIGAGVGAAIGAIAGGGSGAAIGAAVGGGTGAAASLATRGDAAEIPGETELNFTVETPVSITEKK